MSPLRHRMRPLDVHRYLRIRTERAQDAIAGDAMHLRRIDAFPAREFPECAVVERELFDVRATDSVKTAVTHVADPCSVRSQDEGRRGRAHAREFPILLAAAVDARVGLQECFVQSGNSSLAGVFVIGMRDNAGRQLTGLLADRVRTHAVGHKEYMPLFPPLIHVGGQQDGVAVLIVTAADAHVGDASLFDVGEAAHVRLPQAPCLPELFIWYMVAG